MTDVDHGSLVAARELRERIAKDIEWYEAIEGELHEDHQTVVQTLRDAEAFVDEAKRLLMRTYRDGDDSRTNAWFMAVERLFPEEFGQWATFRRSYVAELDDHVAIPLFPGERVLSVHPVPQARWEIIIVKEASRA